MFKAAFSPLWCLLTVALLSSHVVAGGTVSIQSQIKYYVNLVHNSTLAVMTHKSNVNSNGTGYNFYYSFTQEGVTFDSKGL